MRAAVVVSLLLHVLLGAAMARVSPRPMAAPQAALQVTVIEKAPPPPPLAPAPKPLPLKIARAPRAPAPPAIATRPLPQIAAPPPPTREAAEEKSPLIVTGITLESTSQGGTMAVGVGNTLRGAPPPKAVEPGEAKPYKADKYASSAQVTELPRPLNGGSVNLRRYYPPRALRDGFEGDVVLRLLIDSDGSIAKIEIVSDPGEGLGPAAAEAVRREYRFAPATVNGAPVATTVPFTVHFTLD